jgi:serpin B
VGQVGYNFKSDFQQAIASFYDGAFNEVNYALPDEVMKTINAWVSDKTNAKIMNLIERSLINQDTWLLLTNAIYFKGKWEKEVEKNATKDENSHGPKSCKIPMMRQSGGFLYYEGDGFQALDLPYKGGQLLMLVVLPRKKDELNSMERHWADGDIYHQFTNGLDHEATVIVSLPGSRWKRHSG